MANVMDIFNGANTVPVEAWQGSSPETAQSILGVSGTEKIELRALVDREICIIGKIKRQGERGVYYVYLIVPKQDTFALCTVATSSKSFIERVERSKLPVKGTVKMEPGKKGDYYVLA